MSGFQVKIVNFLSCFCLLIPRRDFDTKKAIPNIDACPESLGAMLEYWYMECALLGTNNLPWSKHQELTGVQAIIELEAIACIAGGFGWVFQWAFVAHNRQKNRNCQLNRLSMVAMAMTLCTRLNDLGHLVTLIFLVVRSLSLPILYTLKIHIESECWKLSYFYFSMCGASCFTHEFAVLANAFSQAKNQTCSPSPGHHPLFATSFKHVRNPWDIAATNRTEICTWFTCAILKLQLWRDKNCIELPRQKSPV